MRRQLFSVIFLISCLVAHVNARAPLRQLLYVSRAYSTCLQESDLHDIVSTSRMKNMYNDISGLLVTQGPRILQILEGSPAKIDLIFRSIRDDERHHDVFVLLDAEIAEKDFRTWSYATKPMWPETTPKGVRTRIMKAVVKNVLECPKAFVHAERSPTDLLIDAIELLYAI